MHQQNGSNSNRGEDGKATRPTVGTTDKSDLEHVGTTDKKEKNASHIADIATESEMAPLLSSC